MKPEKDKPNIKLNPRVGIITALNLNVLPQDRKMLEQGYVPIHWLLAKLTYEEATYIRQLALYNGQERMMVRQ